MVFSSLPFVLIFMPVFFSLYYLTPDSYKNITLLIGSLCFYFVGTLKTPGHFILFLISIMLDYFIGVLMEKYNRRKKLLLSVAVVFHVACLFTFKYSAFFAQELGRLLPGTEISLGFVLPIGISFYTFQGLSYVADVYRGKTAAEKSLLDFAVYISMFPQLIAGPIVVYDRVRNDLHERKIHRKAVKNGLGLFVFGMGLKVLLANPIGKLWTDVKAIGFESISTPLAWMAIAAFSLQLYFDFFGYSLMATGLGKMLGFRLPQNFNFPYLSRSMTEFWRRWHITLGAWFKEYVYIPLGGNRNGTLATVRNLLVVWLLTGIWHGAGYNFVLWGAVLFLILVFEKFCIGKYLEKSRVISHIYMLLLILLTWAIFAIDDMTQLGIFFSRLFPFFGQGVWSVFRNDYLKYLGLYYPFFIAGILFSTKLPFKALRKIKNRAVRCVILSAIFIACVYCMVRGFDDPFLYFRF